MTNLVSDEKLPGAVLKILRKHLGFKTMSGQNNLVVCLVYLENNENAIVLYGIDAEKVDPNSNLYYIVSPIDRSLANTMRALRMCMRSLEKRLRAEDSLRHQLSQALVQRYENHPDKRSRYRPKNPDRKPLGDPEVRKMTTEQREKLREFQQSQAA